MHDPTTDPALRTWVEVPDDGDFPIQNLPFGVISPGGEQPRVAVAIGGYALDLAGLARAGLLAAVDDAEALFASSTLNGFLARGRPTWRAVRERVSALLTESAPERREVEQLLVPLRDAAPCLPFAVGDYVDFYSSIEHASNVGRMFRPDAEPLLPNWRHLPVGYHGRAGTVVVSGTDVVRPCGQRRPGDDGQPPFGPTQQLDIELEVGFVAGPGNALGEPIDIDRVEEHLFGFVLVNDWSARDIQAWEYQPLGPFLAKSFATSISPWVVPLDALAPYRVAPPRQEPPPLPHLTARDDWALDLHLEAYLQPAGGDLTRITAADFRDMYWTPAQQLAHATSNGATVRPGDLFASGTVSGASQGTQGSLLELTWRGERPLELTGTERRGFLEDGDTIVLRGWAGGDRRPRVGFGECRGTVRPAPC